MFNWKVDIYHRFETLEWATTYYWPLGTPPALAAIQDLANAESTLVCSQVNYNRFEVFDSLNHKYDEGPLAGDYGTIESFMVQIHYALLLRETAPANKRPSVKYIHGYSVDAFNLNGGLSAGYLLAIGTFGDAVSAAGWADSDNQEIEGMVFRGFTRRSKMRQLIQ